MIAGVVPKNGQTALQVSKGIKGRAPDPYPGAARIIPSLLHVEMGLVAKVADMDREYAKESSNAAYFNSILQKLRSKSARHRRKIDKYRQQKVDEYNERNDTAKVARIDDHDHALHWHFNPENFEIICDICNDVFTTGMYHCPECDAPDDYDICEECMEQHGDLDEAATLHLRQKSISELDEIDAVIDKKIEEENEKYSQIEVIISAIQHDKDLLVGGPALKQYDEKLVEYEIIRNRYYKKFGRKTVQKVPEKMGGHYGAFILHCL